jgi:DHA1 family tetracycline resistance protein-like MFS transporter
VSRPLLVIFLTIFVNLVGFGIIIPLLPFYAQTFGASPLVIGLLFASFSLSQLLASPWLGHLSDQWGRRPVLIFSLIGTVVSFVMLAVAGSLPMLFAARIVDGLSGGNITTARAYVADITTEENRARAFGVLGAAFGLGFIVGPALGALFSHISYTAPIWAAAAITVVATVLAWVWLPETVHRAHAGGGAPWQALKDLGRRPPCACSSASTSRTGRRLPSTRRPSRCSARGDSGSTLRTRGICSARSGFSARSCRERWSGRS